jgi:hypothetical protein
VKINWKAISAFLGAAAAGVGAALFGSKAPAAEPAKPPEEPKFDEIDAEIDSEIERRRAGTTEEVDGAVPLPPRTPLVSVPQDRAENGGAMLGSDAEPEPSTAKPLGR